MLSLTSEIAVIANSRRPGQARKATISMRNWAVPVPDSSAYRRAGGRRRVNQIRRCQALHRKQKLLDLLWRYGFAWGCQKRYARILGVCQQTVSRYFRQLGLIPMPRNRRRFARWRR
jgi:hypothetical protein